MIPPSDREQARAARQSALGKLEDDVNRGLLVEQVTQALVGIYERNHLAEMIEASMRRDHP